MPVLTSDQLGPWLVVVSKGIITRPNYMARDYKLEPWKHDPPPSPTRSSYEMLAGNFVPQLLMLKLIQKDLSISCKNAVLLRHGPGLATGDELILSCTYDTTARTAPTGFGDFTQILVIPNVRRCEFGTLSKAFHSPQEIFGRRKT